MRQELVQCYVVGAAWELYGSMLFLYLGLLSAVHQVGKRVGAVQKEAGKP